MKSKLQPENPSRTDKPFIWHKVPFVGRNYPSNKPIVGYFIPSVVIRGFTLIELIITLTIAGILVAIAIPNMFVFVASNRLSTQVNELIADINLSRNEAIKRNTTTGVCVTAVNGTTCLAGGNWANGWLVYYADPVTLANATIKIHEPLNGNNTLTASAENFIFNRGGFLVSATPPESFTLCDGKLGQSRVVNVPPSGRPSVTEAGC